MDLLAVSNIALDLLSEKNLQTLDGVDKVSRLLNVWAELEYETILRRFRPNFTTKTTTIYYNATQEGYQLPTDYIVMVDVNNRFKIQGNILKPNNVEEVSVSDHDTIGDVREIEYISSDINLLQTAPALFLKALAYEIASSLAYPLTKDSRLASNLESKASGLWRSFNYSNQKERYPRRFQTIKRSTWSTSRRMY